VQADVNHTGVGTPTLLINTFALSDAGAYQVVVSNAFGMATSLVSQVSAHCVAPSGAALPPYSDWTSAATNIQDAINLAQAGDIILVTNGLYAYGGRVMDGVQTNRVALNQALLVQSVNGPRFTIIQGAGATNGNNAVRCAWLTNGATLCGFTLMAGATLSSGNTTSESGGGAWCASSNSLVANCVIVSNTAYAYGVGVYQGMLRNSFIGANAGSVSASGATYSTILVDCTVVSNKAAGAYKPLAMTNCIIYFNSPNYVSAGGLAYSYCCTTPALAGAGNFTNAPQLFADGVHLAAGSPCIDAGTNLTAGLDIFGAAWANPPSIGCAEWQPAPTVSAPSVQLSRSPVGFAIGNAAINGSLPLSYYWLLNGLPLQDNGHFSFTQSPSLAARGILFGDAGYYQLVVSNAFGVVTSAVAQVVIHCVNAAGTNPVVPYLDWATAATNIQDAINASAAGEIVLVTNGVYSSGGMAINSALTNRVALNQAITVTSVNGYQVTTIQGTWVPATTNGPGAVRCAYIADGGILSGFTLCNGATLATGDSSGGGIYCPSTNAWAVNCVLSNNWALNGGGIAGGTLNNSLALLNHAGNFGGGAYDGVLNNCTIDDNSAAFDGGGVYNSMVWNSILIANYRGSGYVPLTYGNDYSGSYYKISYSCTSLSPVFGTADIAADPQFLSFPHIASTSPCVDAGSAAYATGYDLNGQPWNNPPSMGCCEVVQSNLVGPLSVQVSSIWTNILVTRYVPYFAVVTGHASWGQWSFGDGVTSSNTGNGAGHQWTNGGLYNVTFTVFNNDNPAGVTGILPVTVQSPVPPQLASMTPTTNGIQFQFSGQNSANYTIQCATNLVAPVVWQNFRTIYDNHQTNLQISDTAATNTTRFYRVLVQ
jgi:hypothetical protein